MSNIKIRNIVPDNLINETRVTGILHITDTTEATASVGSMVLDGGLAVTKKLYVSSDSNLADTNVADGNTLTVAASGTNRLVIDGSTVNIGLPVLSSISNASIGLGSFIGDNTPVLNFYSKNTGSSSIVSAKINASGGTTSALTSTLGFDAGVYNFGNTTPTSYVNIASTVAAGGPSSGGALRVAGDVAVAGTQYVGGDLIVTGSISGIFTIPPEVSFSYTIPETGGVLRTTTQKFFDVVNVEDFGATGDGVTDDSAAFVNAFAIARKIYARRSGIYLIGDIDLVENTQFDGNGCTVTPVSGANFAIRLKKPNTSITNVIFADASDNIVKSTTLTAGASTTATTLSLTSVTGMAVGNQIIVYLDDGKKHHSFIETIVSLDVTITDGLPSGATSGNVVKAYEGLVVIGGDVSVETTGFSLSRTFFFGASAGVYIKTNARPGQISQIYMKNLKYSGITSRGELNDIFFTDIQIEASVDETDSYVGDNIEDTFVFSTPIHFLSDLRVYVDNVLQTITTDYSFVDSTSIQFVTPPGNTLDVDLINSIDAATGIVCDNRLNTTTPFLGVMSNVVVSDCDYCVKIYDCGITCSNMIIKKCYNGLYINGQNDSAFSFINTTAFDNTAVCIEVLGASVDSCSFGGYLQTKNTATANLLSGSSLGKNVIVGTGAVIFIDSDTWNVRDTDNNTITGTLKYNAVQNITEPGTLTNPGYAFRDDENTGMYAIGDGNIGIVCNGANVLDISSGMVEMETSNILRMNVANSVIQIGSFGGANTPEIDFYSVLTSGLTTIPAKISATGGSDANNSANLVFNAANYNFGSSGVVNVSNTTDSTSSSTGAVIVTGGVAIATTTSSTSETNGGALTVAGGAAIGRKLYVGEDIELILGDVIINNSMRLVIKDVSGSSPFFTVQGDNTFVFYGTDSGGSPRAIFGCGMRQDGSPIQFTAQIEGINTAASTSNITGGIVCRGGIGVSNTTDSSSTTNGGALTVAGGAAIAKAVYIGGQVTLGSPSSDGNISVSSGRGLTLNSNNNYTVTVTNTSSLTSTTSNVNCSTFVVKDVTATTTRFTVTSSATSTINILSSSNTTASTSSSLGAITTTGGISSSNTTDAVSSTNGGSLSVAGGVGIAKKLYVGTDLSVLGTTSILSLSATGTTASSSSITGVLTLVGGIGINNTTDATSATNGGTLTTAGGVGIAKKLFVGGVTSVTDTTASSSSSTGAVITTGGLGISNTTDATSSTNGGTLTTAGGVGIAKKLYVGTDLHTVGRIYLDTNNSGLFFKDASATTPRFICQDDDNFVFYGTDITGSDRPIFTVFQRSSTSSLMVPIQLSVSNTTASSSNSTGSIVTAGGISTTNTTDATSSTNGGTFTIAGGAGIAKKLFVGTVLTVSGATNTVSIVDTATTATTSNTTGSITTSGGVGISNTTEATSATNGGTITTAGGVGIAKKLFVGGVINTVDATSSTSSTTGSITTSGGVGISQSLFIGGAFNTVSTTASTSSTTGSITTAGGIGISNTTEATSATNGGSITTAGGVGIAKKLFVGGALNTVDATNSTSSTTGSITTSGGVGISQSLFIGGAFNTVSTTASTSSTTGSITTAGGIGISNTTEATSATNGGTITTAGGVGIAKKLFVGGITNISNNTASVSSVTGSVITAGGFASSNTTDAISATNGGTFTTAGGVGITKKLFVGGIINTVDATASTSSTLGSITTAGGFASSNTTDALSATNGGTITTAGGAAIAKKLFVGGITSVTNTTASTSSTTGSIITAGGFSSSNTTDATSATNGGTFTTAGGVGIAKKLFVASGTNATSTTSGSVIVTGGVGVSADLYAANLYNGTFHTISSIGVTNLEAASFPVSGANGDNTTGYFSTSSVAYYSIVSQAYTVVPGKSYKISMCTQGRCTGTGGGTQSYTIRFGVAINSTSPVAITRGTVQNIVAFDIIQMAPAANYVFTAGAGATTVTVDLTVLTGTTTRTVIFNYLTTDLQQLN